MAASKSLPLEMATNMVGGCIPSKKLSVQPKFGNSRKYSDKELPKFVDLRPIMTPIENQGNSYAWSVFAYISFASKMITDTFSNFQCW